MFLAFVVDNRKRSRGASNTIVKFKKKKKKKMKVKVIIVLIAGIQSGTTQDAAENKPCMFAHTHSVFIATRKPGSNSRYCSTHTGI